MGLMDRAAAKQHMRDYPEGCGAEDCAACFEAWEEEGITQNMADYGPDQAADHPGREEREQEREQMPEPLVIEGSVGAVAGGEGAEEDLLAEAVRLTDTFGGWTPTGRIPNEWEHTGGARLRLSYANGEVTGTLLPGGWRQMNSMQRGLATKRVRILGRKDLIAFGVSLVEIGMQLPGDLTARVSRKEGSRNATEGEAGRDELRFAPSIVPVLNEDFSTRDESGMLPTQAHGTDAGYDLYTVGEYRVPAGEWADIPCGIAVEIPDHLWGMIIGRSSTLRKKSLMVQISVIDPGYRGPLFVQAWNLGQEEAVIRDKERIGQLILVPNVSWLYAPVWAEGGVLGESSRGSDGFGSSGR